MQTLDNRDRLASADLLLITAGSSQKTAYGAEADTVKLGRMHGELQPARKQKIMQAMQGSYRITSHWHELVLMRAEGSGASSMLLGHLQR